MRVKFWGVDVHTKEAMMKTKPTWIRLTDADRERLLRLSERTTQPWAEPMTLSAIVRICMLRGLELFEAEQK
jgi:predicted DNA-binding protein